MKRTWNLLLSLYAILSCALPLAAVNAQIVTGSASGRHPGPFIEPDSFNPDFQFFAPADVSDYTRQPKPNTGFFFMYDRVYMNVSRPDAVESGYDGDFTWGNRLEMGWVNEEEYGWGLVGWHIDGPNRHRVFSGDEGDTLARFDNSILEFIDTENKANLSSVEINRIFTRQYFHGGGVFEPFLGLRYVKFEDDYIRTGEYFVFDTDLDGTTDTDLLLRGSGRVENNMLGGQLGFRIFKEVSRWKFNTEVRFFCMQNWQFVTARDSSSSTSSNGTLLLVLPTQTNFDDQSTVFGGELKMDVAYKVTRDISLNVGFVLMDFGKGTGRAGSQEPTLNQGFPPVLDVPSVQVDQQDVFIGGLVFGFEINR